MTDQKPNCENCSNNPCLWTDNTPCLSHPGAREWLMRDVVKELERLEPLYYEESGIGVAIAIIRGEK